MSSKEVKFDLRPITPKPRRSRKRAGTKAVSVYEYSKELSAFLDDYNYHPNLTSYLDSIEDKTIDQALLNEIVLWKLNRYVTLTETNSTSVDVLKNLEPGEHRKGRESLEGLLNTHGIDLAMASTILRFRNPKVFQIIDRHAYRAIYGEKYPLYPASRNYRKIELYWGYLDKLVELARNKNLNFKTLDRLLYEFDKQENGKL